jgi:hypothetical protein
MVAEDTVSVVLVVVLVSLVPSPHAEKRMVVTAVIAREKKVFFIIIVD